MARHFVGTSGWSYDHWAGPFYPPELRASDRLGWYAAHLPSTEINASFYNLPSADTVRHWRDTVPPGFVFAAKASRWTTHLKKLKDPPAGADRLIERLDLLGPALGPILFQLPPHWRCNPRRLARFLETLDNRHRWAFELRDHSWITPNVLDLLGSHNAAFCIYQLDGYTTPLEVTADFVYLRLHGPDGPYRGNYDHPALARWADQIRHWLAENRDLYCYFDNDEAGYAPRDARLLLDLLNA